MKKTLDHLKKLANELEEAADKVKAVEKFNREATDLEEALSLIKSVRRRIKAELKDHTP